MVVKSTYIAISGLVTVLAVTLSLFILPRECSLLNNDPGPFVNCLQDLQQIAGIPKLCCWDFGKVNLARGIALVGFLQFAVVGIYSYRQRDSDVPRIILH